MIRDTSSNAKDPNHLYDGIVDYSKGVDSSRSPSLLSNGYVSFATNASFRQGEPHRRPAFTEVRFNTTPELEWSFRYGKHQGEYEYDNPIDNKSYIMFLRGGRLLRYDVSTQILDEISLPSDPAVVTGQDKTRRHYFQQADKYLVIQNGVNTALIWDGTAIRRARDQQNNPANINVSYTSSQGIGTITTTTAHGLSNGDYVVIINALPVGMNGTFKVFDVTTDTYKVKGLPSDIGTASPAGQTFRPMEVPKGLFMEYVMGRLVVVSPDRRTMNIGDIIRSTPEDSDEQSVLWFTEQLILAQSFIFSLPSSQGRIRAIKALQFMGAPTGQGDLLVSGDAGLSSLNLSLPRLEWKTSPIQKVVMQGAGVASHIGVVGYNGDILFRDLETGIRSFRLSESNSQKMPAQTPLSSEMNRVFLTDNKNYLEFTTMEVFDNRLLVSATPVFTRRRIPITLGAPEGGFRLVTLAEPTNTPLVDGGVVQIVSPTTTTDVTVSGYVSEANTFLIPEATELPDGQLFVLSDNNTTEYYHRGLVPLDYTQSSGAFGVVAPGWEGLWTGLQPQGILKVKGQTSPRCFITSFDEVDLQNELWELHTYEGYDMTRQAQEALESDPSYRPELIPSSVELPVFTMQSPFDQKRIYGLDVHMKDIRGTVSLDIEYRNDGDVCWNPWEQSNTTGSAVASICADAGILINEFNPASDGAVQDMPQRRFLRIGYPASRCEVSTTASTRLFFETQLKITWTGFMTLCKLRAMAEKLIENDRGGCWL